MDEAGGRSREDLVFGGVAGLSLLLALGCLVFWILTIHSLYLNAWGDPRLGHVFWEFGSGGGRFQLIYDNGLFGDRPISHFALAGVEYSRFSSGWNLWIPWWLATGIFCIAPSLWIWRTMRRTRQRREGLCPACGYDLRATPRYCPECGRSE